MLCTLNLYRAVYQLYLSKTGVGEGESLPHRLIGLFSVRFSQPSSGSYSKIYRTLRISGCNVSITVITIITNSMTTITTITVVWGI